MGTLLNKLTPLAELSTKAMYPLGFINGVERKTHLTAWGIADLLGYECDDETAFVSETYVVSILMQDGVLPTEIQAAHGRWCALQVAWAWDAPQYALDYLRTGDGEAWKTAVSAETVFENGEASTVGRQAASMAHYAATGDHLSACGAWYTGQLSHLIKLMNDYEGV